MESFTNFDFLDFLLHCVKDLKEIVAVLFSKYTVAVALPSTEGPALARCLFERWITKFGVPRRLISDQGTNMVGKILTETCKLLGIKKLRTTPYHPQSNGVVERFNQTLVGLLRRYISKDQKEGDTLTFSSKYIPSL